jgi:putative ABC transport system ATP-binding protein
MSAVIELRNVGKSYPSPAGQFRALEGVDLEIGRGELAAVQGKSGSGKSTLLNLIGGIDRPSAGSVLVAGLAVHEASESKLTRWRGRRVGIVFQFFQLLPTLTAVENVMLPMDFCDERPPRQRRPHALELLAQVGVADQADKLPAALSGGQQQRVAIARALAMHPKVMLFDEPTSSLDPEMVHEVLQVMLDLSRQGMTMIIVTHEIQFARKAADRILFMDEGQIVEQGSPAELVANPRNERTQKFLRLVMGGV